MLAGLKRKRADSRNFRHITFTTFSLLSRLALESPFGGATWYHYFDDEADPTSSAPRWVQHHVDYSLGFVKRAIDNDPRNKRVPGHVRSIIFDMIRRAD